MTYQRIAIIGAGNMATSLLHGWLAAGMEASCFHVTCRNRAAHESVYHALGVILSTDNVAAAQWAQVLIVAVKPQQMNEVLTEIAPHVDAATVVVSVAAGCELKLIEAYFNDGVSVMRAMPNIAAQFGCSATALFARWDETAHAHTQMTALFNRIGVATWLSVEAHLQLATAIVGSGPAYYCLLTEALMDVACEYGLSVEEARAFVEQTARGAAELIRQSVDSPHQLRQKITSKGGTTAAAIDKMTELGFPQAVRAGVKSAIKRAFELNEAQL